ncbi:uncharacterized protein LOC128898081 [Dryobates pubescens]|uniref:uncharacterized protein LOC128898081 n=1 Tax=Dryobates pubescens TaxID=118200 RepID=UPI0023B981F8|nr:uncharacterized protein LOC128898081 [Dryobates pubescens]
MPNAPKSLLGRDLLEALGAEIKFNKGKVEFRVREEQLIEVLSLALMSPRQEKNRIRESIKDQIYPGVWDTEQPGRAKNALPVVIDLKPGAPPVRLKQYPLRKEDREGVLPIVEKFLKYGLLTECESAYSTAILPVRKAAGGYRLVQDLRAINKITKDIHPVVANPYTLLTQLRTELEWFTVLDLKDAFFCLPLAPESQPLFAFEWENPETNRKCQLTWTVLPQGFKNSPTIFGNQLAKELERWNKPEGNGVLLQYVDDILLATKTRTDCERWTVSMLNFLGLNGYRVSPQKAQIVQQQVTYLGYELTAGQRVLGPERKEAICSIPLPNTVKALRTFLGMTGWCRLWIYNYGLLVKPLCELLKETDKDLQWNGEAEQAFHTLKKELMRAPALGLPDVTKPFLLYSHESQGIALGVLAQTLGPYRRAVAYLSKQLDEVSKGWPGCLRAVAAVAINIQESRKFTMGQKITVLVSHTISAVLEAKGGHWLSPQRFLKYQAIPVEQDDVEIKVANFVNPASFLQGGDGEPVIHDCLETIEATYSSRPDLKEEPLEKADHNWYTDGSSFVTQGERKAGYAVTTAEESGKRPGPAAPQPECTARAAQPATAAARRDGPSRRGRSERTARPLRRRNPRGTTTDRFWPVQSYTNAHRRHIAPPRGVRIPRHHRIRVENLYVLIVLILVELTLTVTVGPFLLLYNILYCLWQTLLCKLWRPEPNRGKELLEAKAKNTRKQQELNVRHADSPTGTKPARVQGKLQGPEVRRRALTGKDRRREVLPEMEDDVEELRRVVVWDYASQTFSSSEALSEDSGDYDTSSSEALSEDSGDYDTSSSEALSEDSGDYETARSEALTEDSEHPDDSTNQVAAETTGHHESSTNQVAAETTGRHESSTNQAPADTSGRHESSTNQARPQQRFRARMASRMRRGLARLGRGFRTAFCYRISMEDEDKALSETSGDYDTISSEALSEDSGDYETARSEALTEDSEHPDDSTNQVAAQTTGHHESSTNQARPRQRFRARMASRMRRGLARLGRGFRTAFCCCISMEDEE